MPYPENSISGVTDKEIDSLCNESMAVQVFLERWSRGGYRQLMPWSDPETDTVVKEQVLRYGRADIVMYHADGTATVIEAKDGINGYQYVASAIGQVSLYATQIAARGTLKRVRRVVMWSGIPDDDKNDLIRDVCKDADVLPICLGHLRATLKLRAALHRLFDTWEECNTSDDRRVSHILEILETFYGVEKR